MFSSSHKKRTKLFTNKKLSPIAFILIFIVNLVIYNINQENEAIKKIRSFTDLTPYSINYIIINTSSAISSFTDYFINIDKLNKKITQLETELLLLRKDLSSNNYIQHENKELLTHLSIKKNYFKNAIVARLLPINYAGKAHHLEIDKGLTQGVKPGLITIDQGGITGQIINSYDNSSEIQTVFSKKFYITGYIQNGEKSQQVLIQGNQNHLEIKHFNTKESIAIGDIVYTSGDNNLIPKGIKIGFVSDILSSEIENFSKIIIQPLSKPYSHNFLMVLLP